MSIAAQAMLYPTDEVIVVGTEEFLNKVEPPRPDEIKAKIKIHLIATPGGDWGNLERATGITRAEADYIMYCDDDDALLPSAVANVKRAVHQNPGRPHMFRMIDPNGAILWQVPELKVSNQGTPCFVFPNNGKIGMWPPGIYEGDFHFMESTIAQYPPNSLVWDTSIICGCRSFGDWPTGTMKL